MTEITLNLFTIVFGVLIFGLGYIGLLIRSILLKKAKDFYSMNVFDKIVQSIILGTFSFLLTSKFFIGLNYTDENVLLSFVLENPLVFLYQFAYVMIFVYFLIIIEVYFRFLRKEKKESKKTKPKKKK